MVQASMFTRRLPEIGELEFFWKDSWEVSDNLQDR